MTLDVVPETSLQENSQTKNSQNKQIKIQVRKANNAKYSKIKLAWFSRRLRPLARKRGGLILQRSRAHTAFRPKLL